MDFVKLKHIARGIRASPWTWAVAILCIVAATATPAAIHAWHGRTADFTHFWHASRAMSEGKDFYAATEGRYIYPPLFAFLLQPLAILPEGGAAMVWVVINALLIVIAVLVVAREASRRCQIEEKLASLLMVVAGALLLQFDKVRALFNLGQSDGVMLLCFACVLRWMERRPVLAGLAVGASANIKYVSAIYVPYFFLRRNFRAAAASVLSFGFFLFLPAVELGIRRTFEYSTLAFRGLARMVGVLSTSDGPDIYGVTWDRSVSITSTVFRATRAAHLSDFVAIVIVLMLLASVLAVLWHFRRGLLSNSAPGLVGLCDWTALVVIALAFSPQTTLRHMVLFLLPYAVALTVLCPPGRLSKRLTLAGAIILMVAALTLPPTSRGAQEAVWRWRAIGGASWCALIFLFTLTWVVSRPDPKVSLS